MSHCTNRFFVLHRAMGAQLFGARASRRHDGFPHVRGESVESSLR